MSDDITDMTRGVYRRQYAGFVRGQRISCVSLASEAWFWRLHAAADDFGNLDGDSVLCHAATAGRRAAQVSADQVAAMVDEMAKFNLVRRYSVAGENFIHIVGFMDRQPAGKNGKRVRRLPCPPWGESDVDGGIQVNPGESSATTNHDQDHSQDHDQLPATQAGGSSRQAAKQPPAPGSGIILPVRISQGSKATEWEIPQPLLDEFVEAFPELDIRRVLQGCAFKLKNGAVSKKSARGMPRFLWDWFQREMRSVRPSGQSTIEDPAAYADRVSKNMKGAVHA